MALYEFQFFDAFGGRPTLDFAHCLDDGAAATAAFAKLMTHDSCRGVEIFQGDRLVARVERPLTAADAKRPAMPRRH